MVTSTVSPPAEVPSNGVREKPQPLLSDVLLSLVGLRRSFARWREESVGGERRGGGDGEVERSR
jgi:hypothetical protein